MRALHGLSPTRAIMLCQCQWCIQVAASLQVAIASATSLYCLQGELIKGVNVSLPPWWFLPGGRKPFRRAHAHDLPNSNVTALTRSQVNSEEVFAYVTNAWLCHVPGRTNFLPQDCVTCVAPMLSLATLLAACGGQVHQFLLWQGWDSAGVWCHRRSRVRHCLRASVAKPLTGTGPPPLPHSPTPPGSPTTPRAPQPPLRH